MRIRTVLIVAFLLASLVPATIFGLWSFRQGVDREFAEVKDRHLLLAENVGRALERYHTDLVGTFDSVAASLLEGEAPIDLEPLMSRLNMRCVFIVDDATGHIDARVDMVETAVSSTLAPPLLAAARDIARDGRTRFSDVLGTTHGGNVILGVRRYGDQIAIAVVETGYFIELGESIAFGKKGHAAIVDASGNVLAHPLPDWVESRKNIAAVSAVQRMMNGETGIEQFYSPALKGDMIAGLTSVPGPGWGVMIPQPVDELYAKVRENNRSILTTLFVALAITTLLVFLLARSLSAPVEELLRVMKANVREKRLANRAAIAGLLPISEFGEVNEQYNLMVDRISEANEKIVTMAYSDGVTGLPNREKFEEMAGDLLERRGETGGALIFLDLDDFKQINDVHGHSVGDAFLRECAERLTSAVEALPDRAGAGPAAMHPVVARFGGDEFAILMPGMTREVELGELLTHLQHQLDLAEGELSFITKRGASIGCARYPADGTRLDELLKCADIAMYHAKKTGKRRWHIYNPSIGTMTSAELRLEVEKAIANGDLVLEYQPKIDARQRTVAGVEALVRWNHPTLGRIEPNLWVPAIARSPVIIQLGEWVVARAMDDHARWQQKGISLPVAVNVGSEHFSADGFVDYLIRTAREKSFDPGRMEIEITEDALFTSQIDADRLIGTMHEAGFRIAIDDFGTGYSNIARLCELPVDCLKIDRSVISESDGNERVASMMECILLMAKKLGCETVAEGVETRSDVERTTAYGVDTLQGFHFSASLPAEHIVDWVGNHDRRAARTGRRRAA